MDARHPLSAAALVAFGTLVLTPACGNDAVHLSAPGTASIASSVAAPQPGASAVVSAPPSTPLIAIALKRRRFERAKIELDGLADVTPHLHDWDVGGVFQQDRLLSGNDERFEILVRAHGDEALEGFQRDHSGYSLSKPASVQICGRSATLVRATREEQIIACVMVAPPGHNHPAYIPPTEIVAVAFEHDHLGIVMTVEVEAADPGRYRPVVDRIIASIACL